MLRAAFIRARLRLLSGVVIIAATAAICAGSAHAIWYAVGLSLCAPWLVLGRDAARIARGEREGLRLAPRGARFVAAEWAPALLLIAGGALAFAGGQPAPALCLFTWTSALVLWADALDRRTSQAGAAWLGVLLPALLILSAPLWMAGWFGQSDWAPWPATLSVGLHPVGMSLAAAGKAALQDPVFYRWTLSGVVEAHPLNWLFGAALYGTLSCLAALAALGAARRPSRSLAHGAGLRITV